LSFKSLDRLFVPNPAIDRKGLFVVSSTRSGKAPDQSPVAELCSIAYAIERLGCRMGEDPERAILRKEALADRVRAVAAQIGGAA
jgi:hypothetical protein